MAIAPQYESDVSAILSHRQDNGADLWTTPDKRLIKGSPFHTLQCAQYLLELGMEPGDPLLQDVAALIFSTWQPDGRFRLSPTGAIYPCQTAQAVRTLCLLGYAKDPRIQATLRHLLDIQYQDGGLRCNKFSFGRGPETEYSNPLPTLLALDAFRFSSEFRANPALDRAVEFLLQHWVLKQPIGPCHYGIGSLFMQVQYPLGGYNLFGYVYTLSFYERARQDPRFLEAFAMLQSKTVDGRIIVERVVPKLAKLTFCKKGAPSELATMRYREVLGNLGKQA